MNPNNPFLSAARAGKNDLWRYIVTLLTAWSLAALSGACPQLVFLAQAYALRQPVSGPGDMMAQPGYVAASVLLSSGALIAGLWFGMRRLHGRPFAALIHPGRSFRWRWMALSAGAWLVLSAAGDAALAFLHPGSYTFVLEPQKLILYALLALFFITTQVASEELLFRGYLTQAFGLRGGFWAAWLAPAVWFGLLHLANPEVGAYGVWMTLPIYIGMGLLLGWVTLRSGGLELALGLHLANNLYGTLLVSAPSSALPSPALFRIQQVDAAGVLAVFVITALGYAWVTRKIRQDIHA
jgi:membrane protease YdiL (CAAX protease family)